MIKEGNRKLWFFGTALFLIFYGMAIGKLPPDAFESCFWAVTLGFGGSNAGEHFAKRNS